MNRIQSWNGHLIERIVPHQPIAERNFRARKSTFHKKKLGILLCFNFMVRMVTDIKVTIVWNIGKSQIRVVVTVIAMDAELEESPGFSITRMLYEAKTSLQRIPFISTLSETCKMNFKEFINTELNNLLVLSGKILSGKIPPHKLCQNDKL